MIIYTASTPRFAAGLFFDVNENTISDDNHYDVGTTSCARMCRLLRVVNRLCTRIGVMLGVDRYSVLDTGFVPSRSNPGRV
jgi:hypothetical protein